MAIEPAVRHYPTPLIIVGSMLLASVLSAGLTLLAVLGAPPWGLAARMAERPSVGPPAAEHGARPLVPAQAATPGAVPAATPTPAATPATAAELGAGPPRGTGYRAAPPTDRLPDGYQRSLFFSGMLGLAIALVGMTMVSRRRRLW